MSENKPFAAIPSTQDLERKNPNFEAVSIHIDTIDPEAYRKINHNPKTLEAKVRGFRTLLEVGFPRKKINPIICLTRPIVDTIEETIDWYVDEMGAENISSCVFKPGLGFAREHLDFEPLGVGFLRVPAPLRDLR